jgi:hypothetical protein
MALLSLAISSKLKSLSSTPPQKKIKIKKNKNCKGRWGIPVIPALGESEAGESWVQGQCELNSNFFLKYKKKIHIFANIDYIVASRKGNNRENRWKLDFYPLIFLYENILSNQNNLNV